MYSHVACDVMKERTLYLLKPSSLIWHLMPYLFLFIVCYALQFRNFSLGIEPMIYCQLLIQIQIYLKNNTLRSNIIMIGIS